MNTSIDALSPFHSRLPYATFDFDLITPACFPAAFDEARRRHREEVEAIINNPEPPTFANTIEALEVAGQDLSRVASAFEVYTYSFFNPEIMLVQEEQAPLNAAHDDSLSMDARLWSRIEKVQDIPSDHPYFDQARRLLDVVRQRFIRDGAALSEDDKQRMKAINLEESTLTTAFSQRVLDGRMAKSIKGTSISELDGLNESDKQAAVAAAQEINHEGWLLSLSNTTIPAFLSEIKSPALRSRILEASMTRNGEEGEFDTRSIVLRLASLRAEKARLLGFETYADFVQDVQMTKTSSRMESLIKKLALPSIAKASSEVAALSEGVGVKDLTTSDLSWAVAEMRRTQFNVDEQEISQYLEFSRVLTEGAFHTAHVLYGLTFHRRHDLPVYHEDVSVYEVRNEKGGIGLFYMDPYSRPSTFKSEGAWMLGLMSGSGLTGSFPVVTNNLNLTKPAPGRPALMTLEDVNTLFHEFGHALHGLLSNTYYPSLSGVNVATDFVELPSQIHEHWMYHQDVFPRYAIHHETGKPLPRELLDRFLSSESLNQGYLTAELASAALLDLAWHTRPPASDAPLERVQSFEDEVLIESGFDPKIVPPRYKTTYFSHIWNSEYSANYGAYIASAVLECDGFAWFEENGGLTRENGRHFHDTILSRGNTAAPEDLYRSFRGRDPDITPLLVHRGLVDTRRSVRPKR